MDLRFLAGITSSEMSGIAVSAFAAICKADGCSRLPSPRMPAPVVLHHQLEGWLRWPQCPRIDDVPILHLTVSDVGKRATCMCLRNWAPNHNGVTRGLSRQRGPTRQSSQRLAAHRAQLAAR